MRHGVVVQARMWCSPTDHTACARERSRTDLSLGFRRGCYRHSPLAWRSPALINRSRLRSGARRPVLINRSRAPPPMLAVIPMPGVRQRCIVPTLGPAPPRLVLSGRFALFTFFSSLREKKRCWRDRAKEWLQRRQKCPFLMENTSRGRDTHLCTRPFRIGNTCGVEAALGERRYS
jgi:hypothetical protein